ncbi:hypothetical protein QQP08_026219 [Theobroma cacao]|nr:hypothetical protein QQP08_026219 [Theobroma cacao]
MVPSLADRSREVPNSISNLLIPTIPLHLEKGKKNCLRKALTGIVSDGVFYCGMPVLAKELKKLSRELSHKTSTRFEFHKEYF